MLAKVVQPKSGSGGGPKQIHSGCQKCMSVAQSDCVSMQGRIQEFKLWGGGAIAEGREGVVGAGRDHAPSLPAMGIRERCKLPSGASPQKLCKFRIQC